MTDKYWIAYTDKTELKCLKFFKRNFRHCFVLINDGEYWISVDPLSNYMDVVVHKVPIDFNMVQYLRNRGYIMQDVQPRRPNKMSPIMPMTCTEAVKRIVGVHKWWIFTPNQLYKYMEKNAWEL